MKRSNILRYIGVTLVVAVLALTGVQLQGAQGDTGEVLICPNVGKYCENDGDCGSINPDCFCAESANECRSEFVMQQ